MRRCLALMLLTLGFLATDVALASSGRAVFGSFAEKANANAEVARLARDLGLPDAQIIEARIGGRSWLRVASGPMDRQPH